ncbi:hypothetical protein SAMN05660772_01294 [Pasteurella testudinis DSM 23072]|uniref:Uncharacterized protein n=1 Tax=Pasteurella testudinis DSM 23072 TaxID=1122938 RepID=A0A1W1V764_9PAST|nr:hypothetical protein SAMN05660772_01294 [Pasteurella testudinis DSM 23072]SUB50197.1 Uncharacterised protein [Pasteurella testudinis]
MPSETALCFFKQAKGFQTASIIIHSAKRLQILCRYRFFACQHRLRRAAENHLPAVAAACTHFNNVIGGGDEFQAVFDDELS